MQTALNLTQRSDVDQQRKNLASFSGKLPRIIRVEHDPIPNGTIVANNPVADMVLVSRHTMLPALFAMLDTKQTVAA